MLQEIWQFFISFFIYPNLIGIGLALAFGAFWIVCYWSPLFKKPWLWGILVGSAIITVILISFIQIPLQFLSGEALVYIWGQDALIQWILLAGIPAIALSGLIQEGAKLIPVVLYWWRKGKNIDPKVGLVIGAVAGAGFGVFEAQWVHSGIFAYGWTWELVQTNGLMALAGFWERFFAVGFHTASCALVGYGLARGWGWQFYLIASFLHAFLNYSIILAQSEILTVVQQEIFIAVWATLVAGIALWLYWRPEKSQAISATHRRKE